MCLNPQFVWVTLASGNIKQPVACRQCWRCKASRLNDYIGRCMAESATSVQTVTVSLTYGERYDLTDKVLTPRHFQLFIKNLRWAGHKIRYLVVGEYGSEKARAHFHAILFFSHIEPLGSRGIVPRYKDDYPLGVTQQAAPFCREIPQKRMVHIREWPYGHIKCDWNADEAAARYVCKYLLSDDKNNAWFSLSKKPALGAAWFAQKAAKARDYGVMPASFQYLPPGAREGQSYYITGASRRDYMNAIATDEGRKPQMSEWVLKSFEKYREVDAETALAEQIEALPDYAQIQYTNLQITGAADLRRLEHRQNTYGPPYWADKFPDGYLIGRSGYPRQVIDKIDQQERERSDKKRQQKLERKAGNG